MNRFSQISLSLLVTQSLRYRTKNLHSPFSQQEAAFCWNSRYRTAIKYSSLTNWLIKIIFFYGKLFHLTRYLHEIWHKISKTRQRSPIKFFRSNLYSIWRPFKLIEQNHTKIFLKYLFSLLCDLCSPCRLFISKNVAW